MAKGDRRLDSDEEMAAPEHEREEEEGDEEGDEEEYEIEEILESKQDMFPGGKTGYLVKWKGYEAEDNSWVNEDDAGGATDLIMAYWNRQKKANPRKSTGPRKSAPSASKAQTRSPEVDEPPAPKRGRTSTAKPIEISEDEDSDRPKSKKPKTNTSASAKKSVAKSISAAKGASQKNKNTKQLTPDDDDDEDDDGQEMFGDLRKWKSAQSWEHIVQRVDTVERTASGKLYVYFTLNAVGMSKTDHPRCREESDICKAKFPNALLEFYESNLRWRKLGEPEDD